MPLYAPMALMRTWNGSWGVSMIFPPTRNGKVCNAMFSAQWCESEMVWGDGGDGSTIMVNVAKMLVVIPAENFNVPIKGSNASGKASFNLAKITEM